MIKAEITKRRNGDVSAFSVHGHAGFDDTGKDIVCAAISILVTNTVNSILEFTKEPIDLEHKFDEDGNVPYIEFKFVNEAVMCGGAKLLVDSMIYGLKSISKDCGDYFKIVEVCSDDRA